MIPLDDALRPTWLFGSTVHEGCDRGGYYNRPNSLNKIRIADVHRQAWMLGPCGSVQCGKARVDGGHWRLPKRGRHLHRVYHAGISRQVHAVHQISRRARCSFPAP